MQQDEQSRRFRLGWALIHLGEAAGRAFNLAGLAHPHLERLAGQSGETANLILLDGEYAMYVDQVVSPSIIRGVPAVGTPLGLHCTAAGKVLLGFLPEEESAELIRRMRLKRLTEKTITDPARLRAELERVRRQGYAVDGEETRAGGLLRSGPDPRPAGEGHGGGLHHGPHPPREPRQYSAPGPDRHVDRRGDLSEVGLQTRNKSTGSLLLELFFGGPGEQRPLGVPQARVDQGLAQLQGHRRGASTTMPSSRSTSAA